MQAFMLYMSGGGVQIFSMGIVFMLLLSPFKNLAAINTGTLQCLSQFTRADVLNDYYQHLHHLRLYQQTRNASQTPRR